MNSKGSFSNFFSGGVFDKHIVCLMGYTWLQGLMDNDRTALIGGLEDFL